VRRRPIETQRDGGGGGGGGVAMQTESDILGEINEQIFLHSKSSSIYSEERKNEVEQYLQKTPAATTNVNKGHRRLLNLSMQGSMIGNMLVKHANERLNESHIETEEDQMSI